MKSIIRFFIFRIKVFLFPVIFLFINTDAFSQAIIKGRITGIDGQALVQATIIVKESKFITLSDSTGSFTISANPGNTIEVSYVGYKDYNFVLRNETVLNISLTAIITKLDDVVLIGYGSIKKKDLTGAIASVSEKNFNQGVFTSPDQLIQGKVSGLQIINNNGQPGGASTIKIRGNSALSGTGQPLFVIDGVPLDGRSLQAGNNPLNFINPEDVASIDVLKDASATAIYGSRGAYGVILINTKKGQPGLTKIEVNISNGISSVLKKIDVLNASEYREALLYYNLNSSIDKGSDVDAFNSITRYAYQQDYSIAGSGGNENGRYRFSMGYLNQDGTLLGTSFKKYNANVIANFKSLADKKLGIDLVANSSQYITDGSLLSGGADNIVRAALSWNPTNKLKNDDGSINITPGDPDNPLALTKHLRDNLKVTTILGSISPYYKFNSWLEYKLLLSINYSTGISRFAAEDAIFFPGFPIGTATIKNYELITGQATHTLNLNKQLSKNINLNAVVGYEYMKFTSKGFGLTGFGVPGTGLGNFGLDYTNYLQYSQANNRSIFSDVDPKSELQSFFGRAIINYRDKYLLTGTFRADGSTKFGENNKYGYFPSFAAAWNISKEKFFKLDLVNSLKIRLGWGKTGNQEFPAGSAQALFGFRDNATLTQINNPNPDLKWQSDRQYNIGIDFSILKGKISGVIDYFNKTTTNLLYPSPPIQPAPAGSVVRWDNLDGKITNKGVEILINSTIINKKKIGFDISVNTTFLDNVVSNLTVPPVFTGFVSGPIEIIQNGLPMNAFYTRKFLGIDKTTGFSLYEDNGNTFYYVGDPNPKTLLGITTTLRYKKFLFIGNMNGAFGQDIFNNTLMNVVNVGGMNGGNIARSVYKEPVKESLANPVTPSSRFIQKGNYLRVSNLTLSYRLGDVVQTFKDATIYFTGQNVFLITKYPGFDPEVNTDRNINSVPSLGIDYAHYPSSRTLLLGIKFTL